VLTVGQLLWNIREAALHYLSSNSRRTAKSREARDSRIPAPGLGLLGVLCGENPLYSLPGGEKKKKGNHRDTEITEQTRRTRNPEHMFCFLCALCVSVVKILLVAAEGCAKKCLPN